MSDNNKWPQDYYKKNNNAKLSFENNMQTFYKSFDENFNHCSQCYFHTDDKKENKDKVDKYPQNYYH